jgi:serine/threonine protein kinase
MSWFCVIIPQMTETRLLNDRYQLINPLGSGGMAIVYKAIDLMLERTVAVKLLREDNTQDAAFRANFRQEARAAANLSHPNIVTVHDFGWDQNQLFIVMEYLPGTDLKTLIHQKGIFKVTEAVEMMIQICAGVGYAHRAGLVHCDIKPHNILVTPDTRLKVTDFGIARALSTIPAEEHNEIVWGSPHYFSPEQARGVAPSPASDVYSLGIILYEMLTGELPFKSEDSTELARMHREDKPIPPRRLNPKIPVTLEDIILKVLSKEPSARYRTADQLGRVLIAFKNSEEGASTVPSLNRAGSTASAPTKSKQKIEMPVKVLESFDEPIEEITDQIRTAIKSVDWINWAIGVLAFTLVLGLIPFWLYVCLTLNP